MNDIEIIKTALALGVVILYVLVFFWVWAYENNIMLNARLDEIERRLEEIE